MSAGLEVIKLFPCSSQLSTKFQLLIKTKYRQIKKCLALSLSDVVFIVLINVKMPAIIGILTFMSRINLCSAELSTECFITSGPAKAMASLSICAAHSPEPTLLDNTISTKISRLGSIYVFSGFLSRTRNLLV